MTLSVNRLTRVFSLSAIAAGLASASLASAAIDRTERNNGTQFEQLRMAEPVTIQAEAGALQTRQPDSNSGTQMVIVRLTGAPAASQGAMARSAVSSIERNQQRFIQRAKALAPSAKVVGSTQTVINAVMLEVDASEIDALASDPLVANVSRAIEYEKHLSETVPYIGGYGLLNIGIDGTGVSVGVVDSGIDYLHAALGGSGDASEFASNDPTIIEPGTFPTAKVVGGYDFIGSNWASSSDPLEPDPDPLDDGSGGGHGTHVADIIAGTIGVAPGADLYALKACSSVSTSCSGIALVQAVDWAADPNGDGDTSDHLDVLNMSLGSNYGQPYDDDLSLAVENASAAGVLVVASAGNGGNKPYITGTPSSTPSALSVAQTQVPSAEQPTIEVGASQYAAVFQPWSVEPASAVSAPLQYGDGAGGNLNGCSEFDSGSLDGLAVLVDRGACNFTLKIYNIQQAGGVVGVIGLIAPGDPFSGGDGGDGPITIPGYMVSQSVSLAMQGQIGETLTVDPANGIPLVGQMVGSSSRGPQDENTTLIKPEIGAPGASVSAIAGTGTDTGPFGGTSGAAPMVSGAAALLLQKTPGMAPATTKAMLMNSADSDILTDPYTGAAPITRIGSGEVRVTHAAISPVTLMDQETGQASLSFGFLDVRQETVTLRKVIEVTNTSDTKQTLSVSPTFRFADDEASGAVSVNVSPTSLSLGAGVTKRVRVTISIDGNMLSGNAMNSGSEGANPDALTAMEFDGYIEFDTGAQTLQMPWHVLPRQAAYVRANTSLNTAGGSTSKRLRNRGVGIAQNDAYALLAVSPDLAEGTEGAQSPTPDIKAVGINTYPVPAGYCSEEASFIWAFAISTWERQEHLLPVTHLIYLDIDQDGNDDYAVLNRDASGLDTISDGRQVSWAFDFANSTLSGYFYAEHSMNTGNTVLMVCAEQIGLSAADMLATNVNMDVVTQDFYYGGPGDSVTGLTVTPYGERFVGTVDDIDPGAEAYMEVDDYGLFPGNTNELGILLFTNGDRGAGARGGATEDTEALMFIAK